MDDGALLNLAFIMSLNIPVHRHRCSRNRSRRSRCCRRCSRPASSRSSRCCPPGWKAGGVGCSLGRRRSLEKGRNNLSEKVFFLRVGRLFLPNRYCYYFRYYPQLKILSGSLKFLSGALKLPSSTYSSKFVLAIADIFIALLNFFTLLNCKLSWGKFKSAKIPK